MKTIQELRDEFERLYEKVHPGTNFSRPNKAGTYLRREIQQAWNVFRETPVGGRPADD